MYPPLARFACLLASAVLFLAGGLGLAAQTTAPTTPTRARLMWMEADDYYQTRGEFSRARELLENVRRHLREQGKAEEKEYINPTARLAKLSSRMGDFDTATKLYDETAAIVAKHFGPEAIETARLKNQQATMLFFAKRYSEAEAKGREAIAIAEKARGADAIDVGIAASLTGATLTEQKRFDEAIALQERAVKIFERRRGIDEESTRSTRFNLAQTYITAGRLDAAKAMLDRAGAASLAGSQGSFSDIEMYRGMVVLALSENDPASAKAPADKLFATQVHLLRDVFPGMKDEERLGAKAQLDLLNWYCSIGDAERIAKALLQTKAITLDRMPSAPPIGAADPFAHLLDPARAAEAFQPIPPELFEQLRRAREAEAQASVPVVPVDPASPTPLHPYTADQVCAALPPDAVVIEFVRYDHHLGNYRAEPHYGAIVFGAKPRPGTSGPALDWIPLGSATPIDTEVSVLLKSVRDPLAGARLATSLRSLHKSVWAPVGGRLAPTIK